MGQVFRLCAGVAGALWLNLPNSARAEVAITGTSNEVRVEAHGAPIEELLSDFHDKFGLSYGNLAPLDHKAVNGTFRGSLLSVLTRLLKDYDHVLKIDNGHISLVLIDQHTYAGKIRSAVLPASAESPESVAATPAVDGASEPSKIQGKTDSAVEQADAQNGHSPSPALRAQSPFSVATYLERQSAAFVNAVSAAANPGSAAAGQSSAAASPGPRVPDVSAATSQAATAQTMERANVTLQALAGALTRLPTK
jgi:hypothetical protein